jgi:hypothetical protein
MLSLSVTVLSADVQCLVMSDPIVKLLMSLTCVEGEVPRIEWNRETWRSMVDGGNVDVVAKLGLHHPLALARWMRSDQISLIRWSEWIVDGPHWSDITTAGMRHRVRVLAARHNTLRILQPIFSPVVEWFDKPRLEVRTAAARGGHLELFHELRCNASFINDEILSAAARSGNYELVRSINCHRIYDCRVVMAAGRSGNLELLKWCASITRLTYFGGPWETQVCKSIARGGSLECLMWAHSQILDGEKQFAWDEQTCKAAAKKGHLKLLQWCMANGCPWNACSLLLGAIKRRQVHIVEWLLTLDEIRELRNCDEYCEAATVAGCLPLLRLLTGHSFRLSNIGYRTAVLIAHLDIVKWYFEQPGECRDGITSFAQSHGTPKVKKWARAQIGNP